MNTEALAGALAGNVAAISAFSGHGHAKQDVRGIGSVIEAARRAACRLLVVGGAGSLAVAPGVQLLDTPNFPAQWKGSAEGARDALKVLRAMTDLDWTMLSPTPNLESGPRAGKVRLSGDKLLINAEGQSRISTADYACAMLDELERPAHKRQRFSVAY